MRSGYIMAFAVTALLLTACSNKPAEESSVQTETTAAQTTMQTAAKSYLNVQTSALPVITAQQTTSLQNETTTTTMTTTTMTTSSSMSSALTSFTTITTTSLVTMPAVSTVQTVNTAAAGGNEDGTLSTAQEQMIASLVAALQKNDREALLRITDLQTFIEAEAVLYPNADAKQQEERVTKCLDQIGLAKAKTYQVTYGAKRPDLMKKYSEMYQDMQENGIAILTDDEQITKKWLADLGGVTEVVSAELEYTDQSGKKGNAALLMFFQNGEWKTDLFLREYLQLPVSREDIVKSKQKKIETLRSGFSYAYKKVKKTLSGITELDGKETVWKADMLEQIPEPDSNDPMLHFRYQMQERCDRMGDDLSDYAEIRFLIEGGECTAVAAQRKDGFVWCTKHSDDVTAFSSLDEAFAHAKKQGA